MVTRRHRGVTKRHRRVTKRHRRVTKHKRSKRTPRSFRRHRPYKIRRRTRRKRGGFAGFGAPAAMAKLQAETLIRDTFNNFNAKQKIQFMDYAKVKEKDRPAFQRKYEAGNHGDYKLLDKFIDTLQS
jgi:hypothetical protein